jgi:hypothetical protein
MALVNGVRDLILEGTFLPDRQERIDRLSPGDPIRLVREPKNRYDRNAIVVLGPTDDVIGYVPAPIAGWMAPILDVLGGEHDGVVDQIGNRDVPETTLAVVVAFSEPTMPSLEFV